MLEIITLALLQLATLAGTPTATSTTTPPPTTTAPANTPPPPAPIGNEGWGNG